MLTLETLHKAAPKGEAGKPAKPWRSKKGAAMIKKAFKRFGKGKMRSGSKKGPVVTDHKQAIAIALSMGRQAMKKSLVDLESGELVEIVPLEKAWSISAQTSGAAMSHALRAAKAGNAAQKSKAAAETKATATALRTYPHNYNPFNKAKIFHNISTTNQFKAQLTFKSRRVPAGANKGQPKVAHGPSNPPSHDDHKLKPNTSKSTKQ